MDRPESSTAVSRTYWLWPRGMGIFYWVMALSISLSDWWPILFGAKKARMHDFIFPSLYILFACFSVIMAYRTFIRLSKDSIEVRRLWGSKALPFDKIKGRRSYTEKADPYSTPARHLVMESNDDRYPRIDIRIKKDNDRFDESFYRWFDSLPDLDKLDGIEEPRSKYANFSLV